MTTQETWTVTVTTAIDKGKSFDHGKHASAHAAFHYIAQTFGVFEHFEQLTACQVTGRAEVLILEDIGAYAHVVRSTGSAN